MVAFMAPQSYPPGNLKILPRSVYENGEKLEYRVHYGFFNAGEATLTIADRYYKLEDKPCYRIEIFGRSTGAFDKIIRIRDTWGSYVDTNALKPLKSFRNVEENKYRLKEEVFYNYEDKVARIEVKDKETKNMPIPDPVQDIVSGYYFLRQIDYNRMKPGEVVSMNAFFDKELYPFKVRYVGRETIKTKFGKVKTIVISPIMPANGMFDGENSIRLWMSDDAARIPLKVRAELYVGAVELDIKNYENIRGSLAKG